MHSQPTCQRRSDNCSEVEVTVSEAVIPGDCAQTYRVVRTFTATDECGNQSTSTQKVDVVDDAAPVVLAGWNGCEDPASCAIDINGLEGEIIPAAASLSCKTIVTTNRRSLRQMSCCPRLTHLK